MNFSDVDLKNLAKIVRIMAETGQGTDYCLEEGCLPLMTHYYTPIPDLKDLKRRGVWSRISRLNGLKMEPEKQIDFLSKLAQTYSSECRWSENPTQNPHEFYYKNNCFTYQCASLLHYMIRHFKPKKIIEVGSGHSSVVINAALELNKQESLECNYEIVDPFPSENTRSLKNLKQAHCIKVEELEESFFSELSSGDILFVDSGHVVKTGSDVNFLILDVLPTLKPGVLIHFHDISLPAEYPEVYYTSPSFRMLWTEAYLLQAFLACNNEFRILAAAAYLRILYPDSLSKIFPNDPIAGSSGSLWIQRI